ncbi:DNA repair ATPase [Alcanivorax nanhaiticus]|uniref:DNA repair ATPase n=1 Tax=Alcanivorax nanhaiticus TaxID=1177154 RepID=A0A095UVC5_9GAMM|nr:DNA repair ATPase [Alcanivorax nanhaiticus]
MLSYVALGLLVFVGLVLFYGVIVIHDIPYDIAKERNHPHQDAIHVAGWVSLFTLHVLWPFLWIWATLYRPERGWGFQAVQEQQKADEALLTELQDKLHAQAERISALEQKLGGQD